MNHFYSVLGVSPSASLKEVKKAYRRKAMQYHPDRNPSPDAQRKFVELDQAYDAIVRIKSGKGNARSTRYSPPPRAKEERKSPGEMNEEDLKRAFQRARITQEYLDKKRSLDFKATFGYMAVTAVALFVLPFAGFILGMVMGVEPLAIILLFVFPGVGIYYFNMLVYKAFDPKRKEMYREFKEALSRV